MGLDLRQASKPTALAVLERPVVGPPAASELRRPMQAGLTTESIQFTLLASRLFSVEYKRSARAKRFFLTWLQSVPDGLEPATSDCSANP
jgi:hypothetical protein